MFFAVFYPMLSSESPTSVHLGRTLREPVFLGGTWEHPLGTDNLGRDILLQLAHALRVSGLVAVVSVFFAGTAGAIFGLLSGYRGGWVDFIVGRLTEAQMALPLLIVAMTLVVALGPSLPTLVLAIALSGWVPFARLVRSETLALREREFVTLAQLSGVHAARILVRHLLPNVIPSTLILATQQIAVAVIEESALSFLGLGVQPPNTSLGLMVGQTRVYMQSDPWLPMVPVLALVVLSLSVNLLGDQMRNKMGVRR
ncbi:ABC transporter permease [Nesterenkonia ebinurensis]|uniref:ABC transporter permease n=1 Tax=Nesterenkonia ebinurensis TaxID=2608252 RepID=UPI00168AE5DB|nr:ABC transporter permease [Nesterenkonia ebinurensis]